ncbi:MAG: hypothetical protein M5U26_28070 [Planctomycetota bacterium]|nr:hypothetical protein [Planctomycetota bacterium]
MLPQDLKARDQTPVSDLLKRKLLGISSIQGAHGQSYQCRSCSHILERKDAATHACPKCGRTYAHEKVEKAYTTWCRNQDGDWLEALGRAYLRTGDQACARRAIEGLLEYARIYPTFPKGPDDGRLTFNWLQDVFIVNSMTRAYDGVYEACTPEERSAIENGLFRNVVKTVDRWFPDNRYPEGNLELAQCIGQIGLVLKDPDLLYRAFYRPDRALDALFTQFAPDGLSPKFPTYHTIMVEQLDGFGDALGEDAGRFYIDKIRFLREALDGTRFPDGSLPGFAHGNVGNRAWKSRAPERSTTYHDSGLTFLRAQTPDGPACLGFHWGQPKRNDGCRFDIQFYALDQHLIQPCGTAPYSHEFFGSWYKHALGGNFILVDGQDHANVGGTLTHELLGAPIQIVCAKVDGLAPGVNAQRHLALLPEGVVVLVDGLQSGAPHRYDWSLHGPGEWNLPLELKAAEGALGKSDGYVALKDVRRGAGKPALVADASLPGGRKGGAATLRAHLVQPAGSEVFTAQGPSGYTAKPMPMLMLRHAGARRLAVVAVLDPARAKETGHVQDVTVEPADLAAASTLTIRVQLSGRTYRFESSFETGRMRLLEPSGLDKPVARALPAAQPERTPPAPPPAAAVAASSPPAPPAAAEHRAALEEALRASALSGKKAHVNVLGRQDEVALVRADARAVFVRIQGNDLPLAWKDLKDEDVARIAFACFNERPELLVHAGALAAGPELQALHARIRDRLYELDPAQARKLASLAGP